MDLANATNAHRFETVDDAKELKFTLLRCESNLVASFGLQQKKDAHVWHTHYLGSTGHYDDSHRREMAAHKESPPMEDHLKVIKNFDCLTSSRDLKDEAELTKEVKDFIRVTTTF